MPDSLRIEYTETGEAEIEAAYNWLRDDFGFETAEGWLAGLTGAVEREANLLAVLDIARPEAPELDRIPGILLHCLLYRTSGGSPWHILHEVTDGDGDGVRNVLRFHRVRHARRRSSLDPEE